MVKKDASFGIIPVFKKGITFEVFIVQQKGGHWCFPKGHPEDGEDHEATAIRELYEETKLEVELILPHEMLEENYQFKHDGKIIKKTVKYFIALVKSQEIELEEEEVLGGLWLDVNEAPKNLTFEEGRKICRQAGQFLQRKGVDI